MMRPLLPALLLSGCGPFFAPATRGTLAVGPATRCESAYGMTVLSQDGAGRGAYSEDSPCPNHEWLEQVVREEAQRIPLTVNEVGSFRLVLVGEDSTLVRDGEPGSWTTDGYTIVCKWWAVREALAGAFPRGRLLP